MVGAWWGGGGGFESNLQAVSVFTVFLSRRVPIFE